MARLPQGVIKRADGLLQKRFTVNGKRYSVYGHTLDDLANKEQKKRLQLAAGQNTNKVITLDKYFERFIVERGKTVKGNTLYNYKNVYRKHIHNVFGHRKVKSIEKGEIQDFQSNLLSNPKYTKTLINRILKIFAIVMQAAMDDEIIVRNPVIGIKPIKDDEKQKATQTIHKALTEEEQELLMQELKSQGAYYYELIGIMLSTGVRPGEVVALSWKDIDTKANVIHIRETLSKDQDGHLIFTTPKTECSLRDIPMNDTIKRVFAEQKKKYLTCCAANGLSDKIFSTPYGKIPTVQQINRDIKKAIKSLNDKGYKIDHFTCHGLRDTFATRYIEQGGSAQTLKTILGHSSLAMTMDLYSHVMPNTKQEEMNRLQIKGL